MHFNALPNKVFHLHQSLLRSPLGIWPYAKLIENYNIIVAFSGALILDKNATPIYSVQLDPADIQAINQICSRPSCARCGIITYDDCVARDVDNKWVIYERSVTGIQIDPYDEVRFILRIKSKSL